MPALDPMNVNFGLLFIGFTACIWEQFFYILTEFYFEVSYWELHQEDPYFVRKLVKGFFVDDLVFRLRK